jgi:hypothetical protein
MVQRVRSYFGPSSRQDPTQVNLGFSQTGILRVEDVVGFYDHLQEVSMGDDLSLDRPDP